MPYDISGEYYYEMEETGLGMILGFYIIYFLIMLAISVGTYVLQSLGMYTIAKRRGINKPWLAWIPVGSAWIMGCISDQYRYVAKGQIKNKRKTLLTLEILVAVMAIVFGVMFGVLIMQMIAYDDTMFAVDQTLEMNVIGSFAGVLGGGLVVSGLSIVLVVVQYMALYDLFTSCEPKNGALYLVLSIFVSITLPIFLFICRNKDEGMPPRKTQLEHIPQPPAESWQPAEPAKEPWENSSEE